MGEHSGKMPQNAEICIDYTKKKVSFNYPYKPKNKNIGYRNNALYSLSFFVLGLSIGIIFIQRILILYMYNGAYSIINPIIFIYCLLIWFYSFIFFFTIVIGNSFSYFIHMRSKIARRNFPNINNIM